ncbi:ABC transporter ATP-binding protein [Clostridium tyrobutyricum]|uniref:ABC transporter ATP-binding protein n=1 Tax=Clostridium tyrobutyricum TaxID=1519 RepID=UPI001C3875D2|nr:energy-coupling factor ABC transporter ATP-binding protein [Clostridium tyrobutyricum]MBV4429408.1 energy-coupling factor ABC transporter ATP-binding protein [Clostridium tyrobutyricum]MBV4444630.1 energy-coupling factor ABC transporter ATP-binding protein [Clostridium tyrobutyricum]
MIELKNVSFSYQGQEHDGLHDIKLKIADGECILFCGRSGCGKTTITRLINGLIPHFYMGELTGFATVDGQNIGDLPMYKIAEKVGSVFQNPRTQFFNVDTDSEIAFGIENEAIPSQELAVRVDETVSELHIEKLRGRNIFELSGGEKQKIAFASVHAMKPDIYLLDEPSSNLDMIAIHELQDNLQLIKEQGKTVLIAEHRLYYLMNVVDRIVYLEQGHIAGVFTSAEFQKLSDMERKAMGLRAIDLRSEKPKDSSFVTSVPVLSIENVSLYYKKQRILENINLTAALGEVIAVVGNNGAGKTTFSRALCGLHKECDGVFLWNGKVLEPKQRLKLSYMVMQDVNYELFAESVESEVSFGIKNPDKRFVEQSLTELGLTPFRDRHPNTLSGGQKQRVAVAVSMVCNKELLVFDEPTSGLDYDSMIQVADLIRKLSDDGKIVFVVTHDYEFVCSTCSRVLHFEEGKMTDDMFVTLGNLSKLKELFDVSRERNGD